MVNSLSVAFLSSKAFLHTCLEIHTLPMHLYSQRIQRDPEPCRKSFAAVDFLGFFIPIVLSDNLTIFGAETSETALQTLMVVCSFNLNAYRRQLNERSFIERPHPTPPLQRLCLDQLGHTINITSEVVDLLAFIDSPRDPIYRFIGIYIRRIRSRPLKVFQQLKTDVLILLSRLLSISVERGEKAVEGGLSENPFAFGLDFGETHVLNTLKKQQLSWFKSLALRTRS